MKSIKSKVLILILIILILFFFILYYGKKYLVRLNTFISENNSLYIKKEINNIIRTNSFFTNDNIYTFVYNNEKEIINLNIDSNKVNNLLKDYSIFISDKLSKKMYLNYLGKYFKTLKTRDNYYLIVPLGIIYDNPFIFNMGPNILLSYDIINVALITIDIDVKNYGLNNVLVNLYLNVDIDQNILKPVLKKTATFKYRFLVSSSIIYGRVSPLIGGSFTTNI